MPSSGARCAAVTITSNASRSGSAAAHGNRASSSQEPPADGHRSHGPDADGPAGTVQRPIRSSILDTPAARILIRDAAATRPVPLLQGGGTKCLEFARGPVAKVRG